MKAITCTQCGATIDEVSERSLIITCDYCGARIMLSGTETKPKPPIQIEPPQLDMEPAMPLSPGKLAAIAGFVVALPVLVLVFGLMGKTSQSTPRYAAASTPYPNPTVMPVWKLPTPAPQKPLPTVNYQPRVAWSGPNDMEYFAEPDVDISSVSHLTSEEVKKTVFKDRVVKLRVTINTSGEIDEVETISGHPLLVDAATRSAKSSIFASRSKPTTRILTYTFRVLKD